MHLIETIEDARNFTPKDPEALAYTTQTTLSVDDTRAIVELLEGRGFRAWSARARTTSAMPRPTARTR